MAKSKGNFLKLADIEETGISPLAFRYWLMTAHYRAQVNFSFEAVKAAQNAARAALTMVQRKQAIDRTP